ncbi:MAG TPA: hypothetical protein O0X39_01015 [Methanocorpusculum sp.]|nr:hypothetical protein [Methanocorpusculum sp.]
MNKQEIQFNLTCAVYLILMFLGTDTSSGVLLLLRPDIPQLISIPVVVFFIGIAIVFWRYVQYRKIDDEN